MDQFESNLLIVPSKQLQREIEEFLDKLTDLNEDQ